MAFLYPWGNTQQLNLDWILQKIKELEAGGGGDGASLDEVANALISASYAVQAYDRSDIVFYDGKLYRANQAIPAPGEAWTPAHWDEILLGNTVSNLVQYVAALSNDQIVNSSNVSGTHTSDALDTLKNAIDTISLDSDSVSNESQVTGDNVTDALDNLNGAITDGTLLNGMPQTAMRIPANSDLNSYTTAGTYYVQSDGDAATIANMPRVASGTLYVINRAIGSYKTQFYFPSTSIQIYYTRNYNNGTWTDWIVKSDSNSNIANVELTNTATQTYSKGDFVVVNGVLQKVIASISNGDSFSSGTNITPAVAMNVIKSMGAHKTFTAKLYDYNTYIRDIPNQWYWKIGELIIVLIETTWNHTDDIQTMVEIRDLPCNVVSGVCYIANLSGTAYGADRTIQGSGQWAYIRPNLKSSEMNNTDGVFQLLIFGYERDGYPYPD